jgi:hypothetical protein
MTNGMTESSGSVRPQGWGELRPRCCAAICGSASPLQPSSNNAQAARRPVSGLDAVHVDSRGQPQPAKETGEDVGAVQQVRLRSEQCRRSD